METGFNNNHIIINIKRYMSPLDLAESIRKHPSYNKGQRIVLYVCYSGAGQPPFAQILATELNASVYASKGLVKINYQTGEVSLEEGEAWELFSPEGVGLRDQRRKIYEEKNIKLWLDMLSKEL